MVQVNSVIHLGHTIYRIHSTWSLDNAHKNKLLYIYTLLISYLMDIPHDKEKYISCTSPYNTCKSRSEGYSCKILIGVHEMHGQMHPNYKDNI